MMASMGLRRLSSYPPGAHLTSPSRKPPSFTIPLPVPGAPLSGPPFCDAVMPRTPEGVPETQIPQTHPPASKIPRL